MLNAICPKHMALSSGNSRRSASARRLTGKPFACGEIIRLVPIGEAFRVASGMLSLKNRNDSPKMRKFLPATDTLTRRGATSSKSHTALRRQEITNRRHEGSERGEALEDR